MCNSSIRRFISLGLVCLLLLACMGTALAAPARPSTLDGELQKAAQEAIRWVSGEGRVGCVVVLDMQGRVLAMADTGSSGGVPLALSLHGTPGRLFTPFTAMAAFAGGHLAVDEVITDLGAFTAENPEHPSYCWITEKQRYKHGFQTVVQGLANTCDYFFYTIAHRTGMEEWYAMGERLGLTRPSGWNLAGESTGVLAQSDLMEAAMGRSTSQITPMAMARYWAAIGNGGYVYDPILFQDEAPKLTDDLSKELGSYLPHILEGLRGVIDVTGTAAKQFRDFEYRDDIYAIAATETLNGQSSASWLAGLAPYDDPQICVVVFWQGGARIPRVVSVFMDVTNAFFERLRID